MSRFMLLPVVTLVACQTVPSENLTEPTVVASVQAAAPDTYKDRIPVAFAAFGACTGETIDVSGELHVTNRIWNEAIQLRIRGHLNSNLAGVGLTTGLRYRFQQITNHRFELEWSSGVAEAEQVFRLAQISQTSAANLYLTMNGTYRYDGVGGVQFIPKKWGFVCQ